MEKNENVTNKISGVMKKVQPWQWVAGIVVVGVGLVSYFKKASQPQAVTYDSSVPADTTAGGSGGGSDSGGYSQSQIDNLNQRIDDLTNSTSSALDQITTGISQQNASTNNMLNQISSQLTHPAVAAPAIASTAAATTTTLVNNAGSAPTATSPDTVHPSVSSNLPAPALDNYVPLATPQKVNNQPIPVPQPMTPAQKQNITNLNTAAPTAAETQKVKNSGLPSGTYLGSKTIGGKKVPIYSP